MLRSTASSVLLAVTTGARAARLLGPGFLARLFSGSAAVPPSLEPHRTAIVLVEYQNEFASPGGLLHDAVKGVMASTGMLANTVKLVDRARSAGVLVVHSPIVFSDTHAELSMNPFGILANVRAAGAFKKSGWGGAIIEALAPRPEDIVLDGKRGLDAFASSNLDFILRMRGITNVALAGFLANCCVESTCVALCDEQEPYCFSTACLPDPFLSDLVWPRMRTAYEKGFNTYTLKDCVAATSQEEQDAAIRWVFLKKWVQDYVDVTLLKSLFSFALSSPGL